MVWDYLVAYGVESSNACCCYAAAAAHHMGSALMSGIVLDRLCSRENRTDHSNLLMCDLLLQLVLFVDFCYFFSNRFFVNFC